MYGVYIIIYRRKLIVQLVNLLCDRNAVFILFRPLKDISAEQLVTGRVHNNYTITKKICIETIV